MSRYGSMPQALVVFRKELKDAVRDRRAIYSVLFGSLLGPLMVGFMMNSLADRQRRLEEITIPVVGMEYAPALVEWLRQQSGVQVVPGPEDAEDAVRGRRDDVVVVVPEDYAARFRSSKPVDVQVISDGSRTTSRPAVQRVRALLQRYSSEIAALRLIGRGVSPAIVTPVRLEEVEVSSAQQRAAVNNGQLANAVFDHQPISLTHALVSRHDQWIFGHDIHDFHPVIPSHTSLSALYSRIRWSMRRAIRSGAVNGNHQQKSFLKGQGERLFCMAAKNLPVCRNPAKLRRWKQSCGS